MRDYDSSVGGIDSASRHDGRQNHRSSNGITTTAEQILRTTEPPSETSFLLNQISFADLLDQELRPTFILDLNDEDENGHDRSVTCPLRPVFCNALLHVSRRLKSIILGTSADDLNEGDKGSSSYADFASWARCPLRDQARDGSLLSITYHGILWQSSTAREHWRIVSGNQFTSFQPHLGHSLGYQIADLPASFTSSGLSVEGLVKLHQSFFDPQYDFTQSSTTHHLPPHLQMFRSVDWNSTSLGSITSWSSGLRILCNIVMADNNPAVLFWGPKSVMIYNESYVKFLGEKHPSALGQSGSVALVEVWEQVDSLLEGGRLSCRSFQLEDALFCLNRHGYTEECYFSSTFLPLVGTDGQVVGFYESVIETTKRIVLDRRVKVLQQMKEQSTQGCSLLEFWRYAKIILGEDPRDIPYANMYSIDKPDSTESTILMPGQPCNLYEYGSLGSYMGESNGDAISALAEASYSTEATILDIPANNMHQHRAKRAKHDKEYLHQPRQKMLLCPLRVSDEARASKLFVMGVHPQRPLDEGYIEFAKSLADILAASLKSIKFAQETEAEQARLEEELQRRTLEVELEETRFARLAASAPVAIWIENLTDGIKFRNEKWWEITQHPRDADKPFSWLDIVHERYASQMDDIRKVLHEKGKVSTELELRRSWTPSEAIASNNPVAVQHSHAWVLCFIQAEEYHKDGKVKSVVGIMTEISRQKWAEGEEARRKEDALESKRQQEAFVDMVSHEVRNPLSAILISAEGIRESLEKATPTRTLSKEFLSSNLDAAGVIVQCALHQKSIVDDILSMSKLDSNLLIITPIAVQPTKIVQNALDMLASEARSARVTMKMNVEDSYKDLSIDWVLLDPSRLTQVLLNLVPNAIKFTASRPKRRVTVSIAASRERRCKESGDIKYVPSNVKHTREDQSGFEGGTDETVYINFAVQDTGCGLTPEEKEHLFQRFSQVFPRTHVQYGGSGLGLFISRTLVEMQGGEIGVATESGVGSTFAFYILARRTVKPDISSTSSFPGPLALPSPSGSPQESRANSSLPATCFPTPSIPSPAKAPLIEPIHVLIVEDNIINQTVLRKQLLAQKWIVYVANHGTEALEFIRTSRFWKGCETSGVELNVVLMDHEMPIMDGVTCVKLIRQMEESGDLVAHVPIIAVTANARAEQVKILEIAGVDDVLLKPFLAADILARVTCLLTGNI